MLPDNLVRAPSVPSSSLEELLATLNRNIKSRKCSAATLSVASARDLARRQATISVTINKGLPSGHGGGKCV